MMNIAKYLDKFKKIDDENIKIQRDNTLGVDLTKTQKLYQDKCRLDQLAEIRK